MALKRDKYDTIFLSLFASALTGAARVVVVISVLTAHHCIALTSTDAGTRRRAGIHLTRCPTA